MTIFGYHPTLGQMVFQLGMLPIGALLMTALYFVARKFRGLLFRVIAVTSARGRRWLIMKFEKRLVRCQRAASNPALQQVEATLAVGRILNHGVKALLIVSIAVATNLMGALTYISEQVSDPKFHGLSVLHYSLTVLSLLLYGMVIREGVAFSYAVATMMDFADPTTYVIFLQLRIGQLKRKDEPTVQASRIEPM